MQSAINKKQPSQGAPQRGDIRERIDELDTQIMNLLNQRARQALEMAKAKRQEGAVVFAPEREDMIISRLRSDSPGPLPLDSLEHIYREIISGCRALQSPLDVAYLGPEYTFSHQVALARFGRSANLNAQYTISEVFEAVERGRSQVGLAPVENSSEGAVGEALDRLVTTSLSVCGETYLAISHALMSLTEDMSGLQRVYSHPQALAQCRGWLSRRLPGAQQIAAASTAEAANKAAGDPQSAAIGSKVLAGASGLTLLAEDIQDSGLNTTRFLVLGQDDCPPCGQDKTSVCFVVSHKPGSLYRALGAMADRGLNLTRIESRPLKDRPWEYVFFADFLGHNQDKVVAEALELVKPETEMFKVLGSYPMAEQPVGPGGVKASQAAQG